MKTLICGGGTGGHIYPALAVIAELKSGQDETHDFLWIGTKGEIEEELVPRAEIDLATIEGGGLVGVPWGRRIRNGLKLLWSMKSVNQIFTDFHPEVLFMTGGYVNLPAALVGRFRRVPTAIYLPDIEPAQSIKALSRIADAVACTAAESKKHIQERKCVVTGYPVRADIRGAMGMDKEEARAGFNLDRSRPTLFVFGGSRGARSINRALMKSLQVLLRDIQIIHVSGTLDWPEVETNYLQLNATQQKSYRPFAYLHDDMGKAFRAADLVVSRAGASILGECPAFGLPSILVPYPYAWRYQKVNADFLVNKGAAVTIKDEELEELLAPTVVNMINDPERMKKMSVSAKNLDTPDSASKIANLLLELGQGKIS